MSNCGCVSTCGCCNGVTAETPAAVSNRPGLSRVAYRAGTHSQFRDTMLARLSTLGLDLLQTRRDDDFSIALIDSWATVADILTFYQERIANENYLRTATERVSLQELAKLIGYSLRPGLAAETYLSFILDEPPVMPPGVTPPANVANSTPKFVPLPPGIKVQSVPGPGEQPQTFETIETIEARSEWNAMRVLTHSPYGNAKRVWLPGSQSTVQTGDMLLFEDDAGKPSIRRVTEVLIDSARGLTRVDIDSAVAVDSGGWVVGPGLPVKSPPPLSVLEARKLTEGVNWVQGDLVAVAHAANWDLDEFANAINQATPQAAAPSMVAHRMGVQARAFAHNGPAWASLPGVQRYDQILNIAADATHASPYLIPAAYPFDWDSYSAFINEHVYWEGRNIDLDNVYPSLVPGKWLAVRDLSVAWFGVRITSNEELSVSHFAVTGRATRLTVKDSDPINLLTRRATRFLGESETFRLAPKPVIDALSGGSSILLDRAQLNLRVGQCIEISGQPFDQASPVKEVRTIAKLWLLNGYTQIELDQAPGYTYFIDTMRINANVALASHGETKQELLGSGDGAQQFQKFVLKQTPLTWLSAGVPSGARSTLAIQVNGVTFNETGSFYGGGNLDRTFVTKQNENGQTVVQFGDGITGSRLPTGQDNVQAKYRQGLGSGGNVRAGQLSQLLTRPLGVKDGSNPVAATGGENPETVEQSRANAPFTVKTLDRVVSLQDYEDFARATAGIAKSLATLSWDQESRAILLTVAGSAGSVLAADGNILNGLTTAIQDAGDPHVSVAVKPYRPVLFTVAASVTTEPDRDGDTVVKAVREALLAAYSFEKRAFAQPVFLSEVIAVMQYVTGVVAVNVTGFYRNGTSPLPPTLPEVLLADPPALSGSGALGAELLTIDPRTLVSVEVAN
jgi:predicted phage baseplate assembly protein